MPTEPIHRTVRPKQQGGLAHARKTANDGLLMLVDKFTEGGQFVPSTDKSATANPSWLASFEGTGRGDGASNGLFASHERPVSVM